MPRCITAGKTARGGNVADERTLSKDRLLTPGEVATLFRVDPKTVTRWASAGRIGSIRTPGGHRRFRESEVRTLLSGEEGTAEQSSVTPASTTGSAATPN